MTFASFFSYWLVFAQVRSINVTAVAITNLLFVAFLAFFQFYRYRIENSSLEVLKSGCEAFAVSFIFVVLFYGMCQGFTSIFARWAVVDCGASFSLVLVTRSFFRIYKDSKSSELSKLPTAIIVGAGELGTTMARLASKGKFDYSIKGFVDDNKDLKDEIIIKYPVLGNTDQLDSIFSSTPADTVLIAITNLESGKIHSIVSTARKHSMDVKIIPSFFGTKGRGEVTVRDIDYSDLLGRKLITIDKEPMFKMFSGKTVLVTGAGGSIGSEICSQLMEYGLERIILLDIDETELHDLALRLLNYEHEWSDKVVPVVCDIRTHDKVQRIFNQYKPDIVFHAAAYKHVPLMEVFPEEAIITNICGSFNVFTACKNTGVQRVVVISTDKAVNPTNVMGATKRVVEKMAATFNEDSDTDFCCVRFGNVIGSRGSMLPLFLEEIRNSKPVTVTDRNIIRYFMAIPEAVSLVFRAATIANGGEVMVLDMGEPVNIYDFAQKLIDVFGDGRSKIVITGLRPGEKLYEELLASKDSTIPTESKKIFKAKVSTDSFTNDQITQMVTDLPTMTTQDMVAKLHSIVPEFKNEKVKENS